MSNISASITITVSDGTQDVDPEMVAALFAGQPFMAGGSVLVNVTRSSSASIVPFSESTE